MKNLKIVSDNDLKDWAKEIFKKNYFKMIDVSKKKLTQNKINIFYHLILMEKN